MCKLRRILKYPITDELSSMPMYRVAVPADADILSVGVQRGTLCVWALVDDTTPARIDAFEPVSALHLKMKIFEIRFTGDTFDASKRKHLRTVFLDNGLVVHLFEVIE